MATGYFGLWPRLRGWPPTGDAFERGYRDYLEMRDMCPDDAEPESWLRGWAAGKAQDRRL